VSDVEATASNIPYGDAFATVGRYCCTRESATTSRLVVFFEVVFRKPTVFKGAWPARRGRGAALIG